MKNENVEAVEVCAEEVVPASNGNVNAEQIVDSIKSICGLANNITDLARVKIEADKQIIIANQQIEQFVLSLEDKQKAREDAMVNVREIHKHLDDMITTANTLALQPDLSELKLQLIQSMLNAADSFIQKLPNL